MFKKGDLVSIKKDGEWVLTDKGVSNFRKKYGNDAEIIAEFLEYIADGSKAKLKFEDGLGFYNSIYGENINEIANVFLEVKESKLMLKEDLKDFMVVVTGHGNTYVVANDVLLRECGRETLDNYNSDLTHKFDCNFDIVRVYSKNNLPKILEDILYSDNIIWERKEKKDITLTLNEQQIKQIEKPLNIKIEVK